jgi:hypothetical protein
MRYRPLLLLLGLLCVAAPEATAKRKIVPVPAWNEYDGVRWGDLVPGETTLGAFDRDYSNEETKAAGVLNGNTSGRTKTELFLAFDGAGPEARLTWIAIFYHGRRGAPTPPEFQSRYGGQEGHLPTRHADWRLQVAPERGAAAVIERGEKGERVAALIFARPEAMAVLSRRVSSREAPIESFLSPADQEPLEVRVGDVEINVDVDRDLDLNERRLERELESSVRLQMPGRTEGSGGVVTVSVSVEPRKKGDQIKSRLTARASLVGEGPYGIVRSHSDDLTEDLAAGSRASRVEREARDLVLRAIGEARDRAESEIQSRRQRALYEALQQTRLALLTFLVSPAR